MKPKNITLDGRMYTHSGIGTYIQNLLREYALLKEVSDYQFSVIIGSDLRDRIPGETYTIKQLDAPIHSLREQVQLPRAIGKTDLLHCPTFNIPIVYRGKLIVTLHDITYLVMLRNLRGLIAKSYVRFMMRKVARKAAKIITVSRFSKQEIIEYLDIAEEKIVVIHNGVGKEFKPLIDDHLIEQAKEKYKIKGAYILYTGNIKLLNKNFDRLRKAFILFRQKNRNYKLVVVGNYPTELANAKATDGILFLGFVDQADLPLLYNGASLFVFPSLHEGFGLPPLEAMACGIPVIISNAASLPEVGGDAAIQVDPYDVDGIAAAMCRILNDHALRKKLTMKGIKRAQGFSWRESAKKTLQVYERVLNE